MKKWTGAGCRYRLNIAQHHSDHCYMAMYVPEQTSSSHTADRQIRFIALNGMRWKRTEQTSERDGNMLWQATEIQQNASGSFQHTLSHIVKKKKRKQCSKHAFGLRLTRIWSHAPKRNTHTHTHTYAIQHKHALAILIAPMRGQCGVSVHCNLSHCIQFLYICKLWEFQNFFTGHRTKETQEWQLIEESSNTFEVNYRFWSTLLHSWSVLPIISIVNTASLMKNFTIYHFLFS